MDDLSILILDRDLCVIRIAFYGDGYVESLTILAQPVKETLTNRMIATLSIIIIPPKPK